MIELSGNFGGKSVASFPGACAAVTLLPKLDKLGQARTSWQNRPSENGASTLVERVRRVRRRIGAGQRSVAVIRRRIAPGQRSVAVIRRRIGAREQSVGPIRRRIVLMCPSVRPIPRRIAPMCPSVAAIRRRTVPMRCFSRSPQLRQPQSHPQAAAGAGLSDELAAVNLGDPPGDEQAQA